MVEAENEAVFRRFYEGAWNAGDLSVVDELLSEGFLNHEVRDVPTPHRESYKRGVVQTRTSYPDWTLVVEEMTAEGDLAPACRKG